MATACSKSKLARVKCIQNIQQQQRKALTCNKAKSNAEPPLINFGTLTGPPNMLRPTNLTHPKGPRGIENITGRVHQSGSAAVI